MNENEYLAQNICEQLEAGSPLVLISIMSMQGSTPRHSGTKMVVGADGKCYGTIGGSLLEAAVIRESQNILTKCKSKIMSYALNGKDTSSQGMICGGKADILLDYIPATQNNSAFFRRLYEMVRNGRDFHLITHLKGTGNFTRVLSHMTLGNDGSLCGSDSIDIEIENLKPEIRHVTSTSVLNFKDTRVMIDRICRLKTVYCFGGGHVAVPTAHIAALVGFRVVIIDDRAEFANPERFPDAAKICVVQDFNYAFDGLEIDKDSFIVIVTRGHQYDRVVLEQSLKTPAGYIGMISSLRKREAIYESLMSKGIKKEQLEQVYSPIGIDIGGETPEEIAVSIVAELIKVRSRQSG